MQNDTETLTDHDGWEADRAELHRMWLNLSWVNDLCMQYEQLEATTEAEISRRRNVDARILEMAKVATTAEICAHFGLNPSHVKRLVRGLRMSKRRNDIEMLEEDL